MVGSYINKIIQLCIYSSTKRGGGGGGGGGVELAVDMCLWSIGIYRFLQSLIIVT